MHRPTPTPEQNAAIEHSGSPLLVLAGPGTGKTTILALRIMILLEKKLVKRNNILAVTFTTKAANEMRERLIQYGLPEQKHPWIATLHSVAKRVLHENSTLLQLPADFLVANSSEAKLVLNDALLSTADKLGVNLQYLRPFLPELRKIWYRGLPLSKVDGEPIRSLYRRYRSLLQFYRSVDFDWLLIHALTILRKNASILAKYQAKARFLLIDEYQDINGAQHDLLKLLGANPDGVFAVGDDDQSIYSWRGGDPRLIMDFAKSFPGACQITVTASQRCPGHILNGALGIISKNTNRIDKRIKATGTEGEPVRILDSKSENAEARSIAEQIEEYIKAKTYRPSDITLLATDTTITELAYRELLKRGIKAVRRMETPLSSLPVGRLLSVIRTVVDSSDNLAVRRSLEQGPIQGFGRIAIRRIISQAESKKCTVWQVLLAPDQNGLTRWAKAIREFVRYIKELRKKKKIQRPPELVRDIANSMGIGSDERARWLLQQTKEIPDGSSLGDFLEYLHSLEVLDVTQESPDEKPDTAVRFLTTYLVKGLEAKLVFVIGLEDGLFPDPNKDIEEQRRLFYVAMTRAKSELYLCTSKMRKVRGFQFYSPSLFLTDIPKKHKIQMTIG